MNQGKVELVEQELARVNINILGINALTWTRMGQFQMTIIATAVGKNPLEKLE